MAGTSKADECCSELLIFTPGLRVQSLNFNVSNIMYLLTFINSSISALMYEETLLDAQSFLSSYLDAC